MNSINHIEEALKALRQGRIILVTDDINRENEGDLICSAEYATPGNVNFMATWGRGLICMPMAEELTNQLNLQPMVEHNNVNHLTAFMVSIDHIQTTTGISAFDRSLTALKCVEDNAKPQDFRRPGHMFPLKAKKGGVLVRNGHTEATVDLCVLANLKPCGLCCEIMADDGMMMKGEELQRFAIQHNLPVVTIASLQQYLRKKNL